MAEEGNETSNGWPLGLEVMNMRLRVTETLHAGPAAPYSLHVPSISFSSFSSSNLDTEINQSTASFFQDHSVPLGRLIGIRPGDGGLYFPRRRVNLDGREKMSVRTVTSDVSRGNEVNMSRGICIPLLLGTIEKMSRSKSKSRP